MAESGDSASDLLVIFGITGDLARKMTFQALYRLERRGLLQCPILGVASDDISVEELVERARKAIEGAGEKIDDKVFDRFAGRLSYLHGDVTDSALYDALEKQIGSKRHCLFYLEMPPFAVRADRREPGQSRAAERIPRRGGKALRSRPEVRE